MTSFLNKKISFLDFTFFAILACTLGVNFSIKLGGIQLSLYRLILIMTFLLFLIPAYNKIKRIQDHNGFLFIKFLFFWLLYSLFTGFWVADYLAWLKNVSFLTSGLIISMLIIANIDTINSFIKAIKIVVFISMALSFLAFFESLTGNYYFLDEDYLEWYSDYSLLSKVSIFREPVTLFGNPNNYGLFLFYSFCFTLFLFFIETRKSLKILYSLFLIVTLFLVVITLSRSSLFGIVIVILFTLIMILFRGTASARNTTLFILFILGVIATQFILSYSYFFDGLFMLEFGTDGTSDSIRASLILNGLEILKNTFFLGSGLGNVEHYMEMKRNLDLGGIVNLHNWWMEILVSSGVLVFLIYIFIYIRNIFILFKKIKLLNGIHIFWLNCIFTGLSLGFIISSIGPSSLIGCEWLWPLMALTYKCSSINES
jgi:teichuronic acid biosynthesis protein TuaE